MAEKYYSWSPYNFSFDNSIRFLDLNGMGPGDYFDTRDAAAIDWSLTYNGASIKNCQEYASVIYTVTVDGKTIYSYSDANTDDKKDGVRISKSDVPDGTTPEATIHSHGCYQEGLDNDNFSKEDMDNGDKLKLDSYVAVPNGTLLEHSQQTDYSSENEISNNLPYDQNDPGSKLMHDQNDPKQQQLAVDPSKTDQQQQPATTTPQQPVTTTPQQ